ncbi:MAG TPA: hypothetical protein VF411_11650, partial [Bacteroidia bacterium]
TIETKDWITIISVAALIGGWFVNGYLNRKNEIAKKRLEYRLPTLKSFLKIWYMVQESNEANPLNLTEYRKLIIEVREDFQLYGQKDEITLFEELVQFSIGKNFDRDKAVKALETLVQLIRTRIRNELDI